MKKILIVTLLLISLAVSAQNEVAEDTIARPAITEAGKAEGTRKEMKIGKDGGSIISSDGKIALIIPEGAISKKTNFSIQPITNMVPNGNGQAYRLEPSGIQFQKPVQLIFYYTPEESADSAQLLMGIAMQDNTGQWFSLKKFVLDTIAKTMTGNITHFSDWSKFDRIKIDPSYGRLKVKKSMNLSINIISDDSGDELSALSPIKKSGIPWKAVWMANEIVNGNATEGKIAVTYRTAIRYTAPNSLPPKNPVAVTAELTGIAYRLNGVTFEKLRLVSNILIYDNAYEVTLISKLNGTAGSELGTVTYRDTGSFVVSLTGKQPTLIEKVNKNLPDKLEYNGKCQITQLKVGSGNIHILGVVYIKLIPDPTSEEANKWIELQFKRAPSIFPVLQFKCPPVGHGGWTTSNNAAGNAMMAAVPAFPQIVRFELKEGEQTLLPLIGESDSDEIYLRIRVKQLKDD
jgi:hypothetical protein